jgi:hypothetical protein
MQALLNVIETGISKGREAVSVIDRKNRNRIQRRRQRTNLNNNSQYLYDEPTITITINPAPTAPTAPPEPPEPPPPQPMIFNESINGDGDDDDETHNPRRRQEVILEEGGETETEMISNTSTCNNRLHSLVRSSEWSSLIERCENHPLEARSESKAIINESTGNTVLHWTVSTAISTGDQQNNSNPPQPLQPLPLYVVVEALLLIDPNMVNIQNKFGKLPLHLACAYRVSTDILQLLMRTNPSTINVCDNNGFSPIHILCDCGCPISSLKVLLQHTQSTSPTTTATSTILTKKDHIFNRTPLNILNQRKNLIMFTSYLEALRVLRQKEHDAIMCGNWNEKDKNKIINDINNAKQMDFWCKARLLILQEYELLSSRPMMMISNNSSLDNNNNNNNNNNDDRNNFNGQSTIIKACLEIKDCPPSLLEYALLVHKEELSMKDNNGDLCLHLACMTNCNNDSNNSNEKQQQQTEHNNNNPNNNAKQQHQRAAVVLDVLLAYPEAAAVTNGAGRLPLEIYLRNNPTSSSSTESSESEASSLSPPPPPPPDSCYNCWSETLQRLISAYPLALEALDVDYRLYPLIFSRMGCASSNTRRNITNVNDNDYSNDNERRSDIIFDMLRGSPALLFTTS